VSDFLAYQPPFVVVCEHPNVTAVAATVIYRLKPAQFEPGFLPTLRAFIRAFIGHRVVVLQQSAVLLVFFRAMVASQIARAGQGD
jgi:hypothetical protein